MTQRGSALFTLRNRKRLSSIVVCVLHVYGVEIAIGQADAESPAWRKEQVEAGGALTIYRNGSYTSSASGSCKSSEANDSNNRVCVLINNECVLVRPQDAPLNNTAEGCDENCTRRDCILRGARGRAAQRCCNPKDDAFSWSDQTTRVCSDSTTKPDCIPQGASVSTVTQMLDAKTDCCPGLRLNGDACVPQGGAEISNPSPSYTAPPMILSPSTAPSTQESRDSGGYGKGRSGSAERTGTAQSPPSGPLSHPRPVHSEAPELQ